jgi:hypothetical protein
MGVLAMGQTTCHAHDSVDLYDHAHLAEVGVFAKVVIQWFVRFSLRALEYGFGMYVGAIVGWVVGYFSGGVYAELFEPVYFADFSNMEEVMRWDQMPYMFAIAGIFVGAVVGALIVFLVPSEPSEPTDKT